MNHDLSAPAEVMWHLDEEEAPEEWTDAIEFPTLREALEAVFNGAPQTGHPWIRCSGVVFSPHDIETNWPQADET